MLSHRPMSMCISIQVPCTVKGTYSIKQNIFRHTYLTMIHLNRLQAMNNMSSVMNMK